MLVVFPTMLLFGFIYFFAYGSLKIMVYISISFFAIYGILNLPGAFLIFRPIARFLKNNAPPTPVDPGVARRIRRLVFLSTIWIMIIGMIYVTLTFIMLLQPPDQMSENNSFDMKMLTPGLILDFAPALVYVHVILPTVIGFFAVTNFSMELRGIFQKNHGMVFSPGKRRIGITLFLAILAIGMIPNFLVILDLNAIARNPGAYDQFTRNNPLVTILIDRVVTLVGLILSMVLITRTITTPVNLLLNRMKEVRDGDLSGNATISSDNEFGVLAGGFNEMVEGLRERELIRTTFGKYVNRDVASAILDRKVDPGGETRECTILVTDIANYTSIAEQLPAREVIRMLNEYFSEIVTIIQKHHGVVNKFIGDSVFAMFNVPLDDPDHPAHAVLAALEIREVCQGRTFGDSRVLHTRVGINTGTVLAGSIGASDRLEYTVIGDDVNIASRLEQLNKEYDTDILTGEQTYRLTRQLFHYRPLGEAKLKGKDQTVHIFHPLGPVFLD